MQSLWISQSLDLNKPVRRFVCRDFPAKAWLMKSRYCCGFNVKTVSEPRHKNIGHYRTHDFIHIPCGFLVGVLFTPLGERELYYNGGKYIISSSCNYLAKTVGEINSVKYDQLLCPAH